LLKFKCNREFELEAYLKLLVFLKPKAMANILKWL
jgi:hypothetical protein